MEREFPIHLYEEWYEITNESISQEVERSYFQAIHTKLLLGRER